MPLPKVTERYLVSVFLILIFLFLRDLITTCTRHRPREDWRGLRQNVWQDVKDEVGVLKMAC